MGSFCCLPHSGNSVLKQPHVLEILCYSPMLSEFESKKAPLPLEFQDVVWVQIFSGIPLRDQNHNWKNPFICHWFLIAYLSILDWNCTKILDNSILLHGMTLPLTIFKSVLYFRIPGPLQLTTPHILLLAPPSSLCQSLLHTHLAREENSVYPRKVNSHSEQLHVLLHTHWS